MYRAGREWPAGHAVSSRLQTAVGPKTGPTGVGRRGALQGVLDPALVLDLVLVREYLEPEGVSLIRVMRPVNPSFFGLMFLVIHRRFLSDQAATGASDAGAGGGMGSALWLSGWEMRSTAATARPVAGAETARTTLEELARVAGTRRAIEKCFEEAKGQVGGLDQ